MGVNARGWFRKRDGCAVVVSCPTGLSRLFDIPTAVSPDSPATLESGLAVGAADGRATER